jgi:hypothetical protein
MANDENTCPKRRIRSRKRNVYLLFSTKNLNKLQRRCGALTSWNTGRALERKGSATGFPLSLIYLQFFVLEKFTMNIRGYFSPSDTCLMNRMTSNHLISTNFNKRLTIGGTDTT